MKILGKTSTLCRNAICNDEMKDIANLWLRHHEEFLPNSGLSWLESFNTIFFSFTDLATASTRNHLRRVRVALYLSLNNSEILSSLHSESVCEPPLCIPQKRLSPVFCLFNKWRKRCTRAARISVFISGADLPRGRESFITKRRSYHQIDI